MKQVLAVYYHLPDLVWPTEAVAVDRPENSIREEAVPETDPEAAPETVLGVVRLRSSATA